MQYKPEVVEVLKRYRILNPDGSPRIVDLRRRTGGMAPLGVGPILAPDVIQKLVRADTTPDKRWLDWIFFQAGGGQKAVDKTEQALDIIKRQFISVRVNGWTHPETKEYYRPISQEAAEQRWEKAKAKFEQELSCVDQDAMFMHVFGWYRNWPGKDNVYAHVVEAITDYLKHYRLLLKMNAELVKEGRDRDQQPATPEKIKTWEQMNQITGTVKRYWASKQARTDIRLANDNKPIYEDANIVVYAPLTFAASIRYGHAGFPWSNPDAFETAAMGDTSSYAYRDPWKDRVGKTKSVVVHITFKAPVPVTSVSVGRPQVYDLTDLSLLLNAANAKQDPNTWSVFDQENPESNARTVQSVRLMIEQEPLRQQGSAEDAEDESAFLRGANVYTTAEEAQQVLASFDRAIEAVQQWLNTFDFSQVTPATLTTK